MPFMSALALHDVANSPDTVAGTDMLDSRSWPTRTTGSAADRHWVLTRRP